MSTLAPGANTALPPGSTVGLQLRAQSGHADLIVLCVRADGTADGDNGVALWSQPVTAGGSVVIDPASDSVSVQLTSLPADVHRLVVVAQADGAPDLAAAGALSATVSVDTVAAVELSVPQLPSLPTVQVAEIYRHGAGWKVRCLGDGYADGLQRLLEVHGIVVDDDAPQAPASAVTPAAPAQPASAGESRIDLEKRRQIDIVKKVQATGSVSLTKRVEAAAVTLDKRGLLGQRAQVVLVLDVSGSSRPLFRDGRYQVLIERALAAGLLFDDDGTIQAWLFDSQLHQAPDITLQNFQSWADGVASMRNIWGGTRYAPPIERIARDVGRGRPLPTYCIFITDGGNADRRDAAAAMKAAASAAVFWQFMAVGRERDFPFLQKLDDLSGREVDNADFFAVEKPAAVPDEAFFGSMMQEFPGWIAAARQRGILR